MRQNSIDRTATTVAMSNEGQCVRTLRTVCIRMTRRADKLGGDRVVEDLGQHVAAPGEVRDTISMNRPWPKRPLTS